MIPGSGQAAGMPIQGGLRTTTAEDRSLTDAPSGRRTRAYIEELLPDVLDGTIQPGRVFDRTIRLDEVPEGYRAMATREALKVIINF